MIYTVRHLKWEIFITFFIKMPHKSIDLKLTAVLYYLDHSHTLEDTCRVFHCSKSSLHRWVIQYLETQSLHRLYPSACSYKIRQIHVDEALLYLSSHQTVSIPELHAYLKNKFDDFSITDDHLRRVVRDNNLTRKRTRYGQQKQHRKFKEPIKGKGFRCLFRRHGYKVYLVDEHKTSCRCANCGCETTTFRWCKNPKYWIDDVIKRHGLLRCKNGCGLWNRDTNGAINIWKIAKEAIFQRERPEYLKRTKRSISGVSSTPTTQDLHEDPTMGISHFKCRTV